MQRFEWMHLGIFCALCLLFFPGKVVGQDLDRLKAISKIRIDPDQAYGGQVSEFFESIEYIPLETSKESLFGKVDDLVVTPQSIIVQDRDTHSVLFFKKNGKFITRVKYKSENSNWIAYDWALNRLVLSSKDRALGKIEISMYSDLGKPLKIEGSGVFSGKYYGIIPLGNGYSVAFSNCYRDQGQKPTDSIYHLVNILKGDKKYKGYFPYSQIANPAVCTWGLGGIRPSALIQNNGLLLSLPLDHTVYQVTSDSAIKIFQFVLPAKYSFSRAFIDSSDENFINKLRSSLLYDPLRIINVSNIVMAGAHLLFKLNPLMPVANSVQQPFNLVYNLENGKLVALERLSGDSTNTFLPIRDNASFLYSTHGLKYDQSAFYTDISSFTMFATYTNNQARNPSYSKVLLDYFNSQTRKSNPVIVKMKFRNF